MKLPKMYRKKRGGRQVGSWRAMVKGDEVNLGTSDAEEARKRLRAAVAHGKRRFDDELDAAANLDGDDGTQNGTGSPVGTATNPPSSPALNAAPAKAAAVAPDAVFGPQPPLGSVPPPPPPPPALPPVPPPAAAESPDDMAAAAAEVGGGSANDNAGAAGGAPQMSPDELDAFLRLGAERIVDLQLYLQATAIKRATGKVPGDVQLPAEMRNAAAGAWVTQLRIWIPVDTMLPPWALALIIPAMMIPAQLATAKAPSTDGESPAKAAA